MRPAIRSMRRLRKRSTVGASISACGSGDGQRLVAQQVHVALRDPHAACGGDALLLDLEHVRLGAVHEVARDLAIAIQALVRGEVRLRRFARGIEHQHHLLRGEPAVVGLLRVADHPRAQRRKVGFRAIDQLAIGLDRRPDARFVHGLRDDELGFLLVIAQQVDRLVLDARKLRRLSVRRQQLVERLVNRVEQVADRDLDRAAALGHRVTRREIDRGQVSGAGLVKCRHALRDTGRPGAQFEVGRERVVHHLPQAVLDRRGRRRRGRYGRFFARLQSVRRPRNRRGREDQRAKDA